MRYPTYSRRSPTCYVAILAVVINNLLIPPRFIAVQVQHSYNSSIIGWTLLTHVLTLSAKSKIKKKIKCNQTKNPSLTIIELTTSALSAGHLTHYITRVTYANPAI